MKQKAIQSRKTVQAKEASLATHFQEFILPMGLILVSLILVPKQNDPALIPRMVAWSAILLIWTFLQVLQIRKSGESLRMHTPRIGKWIAIWMGGMVLAHGLSLIAATNIPEAILANVRNLFFLLSMVVVIWQIQQGGEFGRKIWFRAIAFMGAVQSILGLLQLAGIAGMDLPGGPALPFGTQVNPNLLGSLITLSLPAAFWVFRYEQGAIKWAGLLALALGFPTVYLSNSRASLLILWVWALVLIPIFPYFFAGKFEGKRAKYAGWLAGIILAVGLFGVLYVGWGRKEMPKTWKALTDAQAKISPELTSAEVRMVLWNKSFQMGKSHLATGIGAGNWKIEIPKYGIKGDDVSGRYGVRYFIRPHNDFLGYFAETGLLGGISFLGLMVSLVFFGFKGFFKGENGKPNWVRLLGALGVLGYMTDAFFAFPGERVMHPAFLAVFAAFSISGQFAGKKALEGIVRKVFQWGMIVGLGSVLIIQILRLGPDATIFRIRKAKEGKQWAKVLKECTFSEKGFTSIEPQSATPVDWYKAMALLSMGRLEEGLVASESAGKYAPWNIAVRSNLAGAYAMNGRLDEAIKNYEAIVACFPDHNEAKVNLGICLYQANRKEEARKILETVEGDYKSPQMEGLKQLLVPQE